MINKITSKKILIIFVLTIISGQPNNFMLHASASNQVMANVSVTNNTQASYNVQIVTSPIFSDLECPYKHHCPKQNSKSIPYNNNSPFVVGKKNSLNLR